MMQDVPLPGEGTGKGIQRGARGRSRCDRVSPSQTTMQRAGSAVPDMVSGYCKAWSTGISALATSDASIRHRPQPSTAIAACRPSSIRILIRIRCCCTSRIVAVASAATAPAMMRIVIVVYAGSGSRRRKSPRRSVPAAAMANGADLPPLARCRHPNFVQILSDWRKPAENRFFRSGRKLYNPLILWCRWADSNRRPTDYESVALPTELHRHARGRRVYRISRRRPRPNLSGPARPADPDDDFDALHFRPRRKSP